MHESMIWSSAAGEPTMSGKRSAVKIVGGGFGGLPAARALKHAPVNEVLIDRFQDHLYQSLLCQLPSRYLRRGKWRPPFAAFYERPQHDCCARCSHGLGILIRRTIS
jgi:cation diffusion facilitator CzcD-associated flavoprotein CzcO